MGTPRPSFFDELMPIGIRLITSTPQATATSTTPAPTSDVARLVACWLEPHWVSIVVAAVAWGSPALSQAVRAMLNDCSPTWLTQPPTTWPISAGSMPERATTSRCTCGQQVGGVHGGQAAATAADGRAHGFDDHDVRHARQRTGRPPPPAKTERLARGRGVATPVRSGAAPARGDGERAHVRGGRRPTVLAS